MAAHYGNSSEGRLKQEDLEFKANLSKQQDLDSKVCVCVGGGIRSL